MTLVDSRVSPEANAMREAERATHSNCPCSRDEDELLFNLVTMRRSSELERINLINAGVSEQNHKRNDQSELGP